MGLHLVKYQQWKQSAQVKETSRGPLSQALYALEKDI